MQRGWPYEWKTQILSEKTEHFYSSIVCPSSARSKRMVQQEVYFRSKIIERNSTGRSDGVCSAVGAKSLKRWSWKRDRESAKALFTWIFLDINSKTIGRTNFMTNCDFDILLFIIKNSAWLSIRNNSFLFTNWGVQIKSAIKIGINSRNEMSDINYLSFQWAGYRSWAQWPDKYAAQPRFIFPAESVNSSRVSLDRQSLSGK